MAVDPVVQRGAPGVGLHRLDDRVPHPHVVGRTHRGGGEERVTQRGAGGVGRDVLGEAGDVADDPRPQPAAGAATDGDEPG